MIRLALANVVLCALGAVLAVIWADSGKAPPSTAPKPPVWDAAAPLHHEDDPFQEDDVVEACVADPCGAPVAHRWIRSLGLSGACRSWHCGDDTDTGVTDCR